MLCLSHIFHNTPYLEKSNITMVKCKKEIENWAKIEKERQKDYLVEHIKIVEARDLEMSFECFIFCTR